MRFTKTTVAMIGMGLVCWFAGMLIAQSYSDQDLLNQGHKAYDKDDVDCVAASKFFFAYILRNPSSSRRADLQKAIDWCETNTAVYAGDKADDSNSKPVTKKPALPNLALPEQPKKDRRCDIYAKIAVAQNIANVVNACGFSGGRWDSDYNYHYDWCTTAKSQDTRMESQIRLNMLNQCAP